MNESMYCMYLIPCTRLNMLERHELISKDSDPDHKQKIIYSLTQKGIDLLPIIQAVIWSFKYMPFDPEVNRHAKMIVEGGPHVMETVMQQLRKEHLKS